MEVSHSRINHSQAYIIYAFDEQEWRRQQGER